MKKRFSILIPLILLAVSAVSSSLIFQQEERENKNYIEQLAMREVGLQMGLLQNILYNRLTGGDEEEALLSLSLAAMRPGMRALLLADAGNRVMMSNRFRWKGEPAADVSAYSTTDAFMAARSGTSRLAPSPSDTSLLQGYYPLIVKYRRGGLEKEIGMLYVELDIGEQLREAHRTTMVQSMLFGGSSLAAALLIAVILHYLVSKRVHLLVGAARRLAAGDYTAQTRLRGGDELSELGEAFDTMAQSVARNVA
jgi:methyl-accepting chemotaxis protein